MENQLSNNKRYEARDFSPNIKWFIFLIFSVLYMESLLRLITTGNLFTPGTFYGLLFGFNVCLILYIISTIFTGKINLIISFVILLILSLLFSSQMVYYKIFKTFYTSYSVGNAGQVMEFSAQALSFTKANFHFVVLLFIPFIVFMLSVRKIFPLERMEGKYIILGLVTIVLIHFFALLSIGLGSKDENSPYNLYHNIHYPNFSVDNLGLLTYMRLDIQRNITGWSPKFTGELPDPDIDLGEAPEENPKIPEKPIEYNVLDIDFDELMANEKDEEILEMHKYFSLVKPTEKNEYTGLYKDYNFILLTAEAFSHLAVDKDITPTLYKMVHEGYYFKNFYTPIWGVSTSDGEYVANTSLIPKSGVWSFKESSNIYMPFVMGNQLKRLGYSARAYHNHTYTYYDRHLSHPNMGYIYKGYGNGLDVQYTWPESDLEMMKLTIPEFINDDKFHVNYMTVSGHMEYTFMDNYIASKNRRFVEHLPYTERPKGYLAGNIELDRALEYLLNKLEEAGVAEKTLIALSADHYPYGLEVIEMEELAGHEIEENFELYRNAFILYKPGMKAQVIEKPVSSLDIIPTVSNLLGLDYDSRLLMGVDAFSNADPLIIFNNRSFITDRGRYNSQTKTYIPNPGFEEDEEYRKAISNIINAKFFFSAKILDTDYYSKVLKK